MEATAMLLLFTILLAGQRGCTVSVAAGEAGFSVDFIHRDSARSPYRHPALSPHARALAAARRSLQGNVLGRSYGDAPSPFAAPAPADAPVTAADGSVESKIITRSFEYLMYVNVGTPPTQLLAIADTGSDLVWVNCSGSGGGGGGGGGGGSDGRSYAGAGAGGNVVFQPSRSSTYGQVSCQSEACQALSQASCDADSECQYQYSYGDGSRTLGVLSTETFSFDDGAGNGQVRVPRVNFGCSTESAGTFRSDGLVGLGAGPVSLVSQLAATTNIGRRFSYCLVPSYEANSSSILNFGSRAVVSEPGAASTPLVPSDVDSYYTVALESAAVAGQEVATHDSRIIVDSGTTLTFLEPGLLEPLVAELEKRIKLQRVQPPEQLLQLCYDVQGKSQTDNFGIPDVTLSFGGGAAVTLKPENTFSLLEEGTLCLVLVPVSDSQPVSILGNIAQQNFHVGYDLDARKVTFAAADCARSSASS